MFFAKGLSSKIALAATIGMLSLTSSASAQSLISFWDFNEGFDGGADAVQIVHNADLGLGTMYQQRADIDSNGKGGNAFSDGAFGIDSADGRSIAWDDVAKSGDNDAELFLVFSTAGFKDIQISFDLQGNLDGGIASYDVKYDNSDLEDIVDPNGSGTMIKDFAGGISTDFLNNAPITTTDEYMRFSIDLTGAVGVDNQSTLAVRIDDIRENDDARFDNFLVTGTAIPEPSSLGLVLLGFASIAARRRKN